LTKVNRCLTEGRQAFARRLAGIRQDPELRGQVEAAASAWTLLAQYVAEER
jgi:hypothetical protein